MVMFNKRFLFGTKASTLQRLEPLLKKSVIPRFTCFTVEEWLEGDRDSVLSRIGERFGRAAVIVRSSAQGEDGSNEAHAGAFLSIPDVAASDREALSRAIEAVIDSYRKKPRDGQDDDADSQVIVQQMVGDVLLTGVLFTQDLDTGAPYYVINYDDESGRTETITAGSGYSNRTLYVFRDSASQITSPRFRRVLDAVGEIEEVVEDSCLDIEFALDADLTVQLFQVRQITTQPNWNRGLTLMIKDTLARLREGLAERYGDGKDLGGVVLGNMSDWNPAEMIGTTPRSLAFSLYRTLITDRSWRVARRLMGYREARGKPLMISLAGQPYIDVRESFRSYLPADLPDPIGGKLVRAWLDRLRRHHHLHDKIEFDVAVTAYAFDFDRRVAEQFPDALTEAELDLFRDRLRRLTNDLLTGRVASIEDQLKTVELLARRRGSIIGGSDRPTIDMLSELLEDAVDYGTIPFSILARHGFIAASLLRSLVAREAMTQEELRDFQLSVPTIATELVRDVGRTVSGELAEEDFLTRYGHLRPGTYDISSWRYDQRIRGLAAGSPGHHAAEQRPPFAPGEKLRRDVGRLISEHRIETDVDGLFAYCRAAIQGREQAKFVFTHNVSDALEIVAALGLRYGLSREELSHISVREILDAFIEPQGRSLESHLRGLSRRGAESHAVTTSIRLPSLITRGSDLVIVPLVVEQPNFITRKSVRGEVALLSGRDPAEASIAGKIVAIRSADPGFDWIFAHGIGGLITKYGGANSHMAIRCAEFGLPAAIGCGEQIFERVLRAGSVELNCAAGQILDG